MIFTYLLLLVPLSVGLAYRHTPPLWVFVTAAAAIVPLADWMRRATEEMTKSAGSAVGGLLNVTFGNAAELILALFVLRSGKAHVVKAVITGSIIGNSLLGLGLAILAGGWGRAKQVFPRARAGLLGSLLILSVTALLLPAFFDYTERRLSATPNTGVLDEYLSLGVSVVSIVVYAGNLMYTLVTHRDVFAVEEKHERALWSLGRSLTILLGATAAVAVEAQLVSGALAATAGGLGLSEFFLGVIVLPLAGNAAEFFAALAFARQDRMGLVMSIAVGSSIQVALLTAPLLVLVSYILGRPMDLVFSSPLELIAIAGVAFAVNSIAQDGETTWFEGLLLVAVYALFALAFFFVTQ
ncbi:MAG TPA: calcium/proton exchanger [Candidatus Binatia bacterium]|nr:calcium/proton exchanger [Candidatus Binatia bacterium]